MRLTLMTDYALRLLMYLAERPERLCTIGEVAEAHAISNAHLTKITHQLGLQGWIETVRGKRGGMRLAHPPAAINLGAVIRGIEPDFNIVECLGSGSRCTLTGRCRLTQVLDDAGHAFLAHLDARSLADVMPQPGNGVAPLVRHARPAAPRPH